MTPEIIPAAARSGRYGLRISAGSEFEFVRRPFPATPQVVIRFHVRLPSLPASTQHLLHLEPTSGQTAKLRFNATTGRLQAAFWSSVQDASLPVMPGAWHRVDMRVTTNATPRTIEWEVDGVPQATVSEVDAAADLIRLQIGAEGSATYVCDYDDFAMSHTAGDFPIGEGFVVPLRPNADGGHNAGANVIERQDAQDIGVVTAFDLLDELPMSSAADYVRQVAVGAGQFAEVQFEDVGVTAIQDVMGLLAYTSSGTSVNNGACVARRADGTEAEIGHAGRAARHVRVRPFLQVGPRNPPRRRVDAARGERPAHEDGLLDRRLPDSPVAVRALRGGGARQRAGPPPVGGAERWRPQHRRAHRRDLGHESHVLGADAGAGGGGRRAAVRGHGDVLRGLRERPDLGRGLPGALGRGGTPQGTAEGTPVGVYRAYTELSLWQAQDENAALDPTVRDFDTSRDLLSRGAAMLVACYADGAMDDVVSVTGWTTGPASYIRIFTPVGPHLVGASQRHTGTAGTGFRLAPVTSGGTNIINVNVAYVRIEGLEIDGSGVTASQAVRGITIQNGLSNVGDIRIDSCVIHGLHTTLAGLSTEGSMGILDVQTSAGWGPPLLVTNNVIYDITNTVLHGHIAGIHVGSRGTSYVYNNTVYSINNQGDGSVSGPAWGIYGKAWPELTGVTIVAQNNYVGDVRAPLDPGGNRWCYDVESGAVMNQSYNVSSDATAAGTGSQTGKTAYATYFLNVGSGTENLRLTGTSAALWGSSGANLSATFTNDLAGRVRSVPWDIGAFGFGGTTAVRLMSFSAVPGDGSVLLEWRTGSELSNLGFHVYRGPSAGGSVDAADVVAHPGPGLLSDRPVVLVDGHGSRERGDVLLPARGRGHGVGVDVPRSGVGDAGCGLGSAPSGRRRWRAGGGRRLGRWFGGRWWSDEHDLPVVGAGVSRRVAVGRRRVHAARGPGRGVVRGPLARRAGSDARAADGWLLGPAQRPRGRCGCSCRASTRRGSLRPRRCRCVARSWRRWSGRRCASCRRRRWTCAGSRDFAPRRWVLRRCPSRGTGRCVRGVATSRRRACRGGTCRSTWLASGGRCSRGRRRVRSWR